MGNNLHQVQLFLPSELECLLGFHDADLRSILVYEPDLGSTDAFVDAISITTVASIALTPSLNVSPPGLQA